MPEKFRGTPRAGCRSQLAFSQVHRLDPGFECQAERSETAVRIDAVAVELARSAGGEDEDRALKEDEPERIVSAGQLWPHREDARDMPGVREDADGGRVIVERYGEAESLLGQNLDHKSRRAWAAARGAPDLVVVGLVTKGAAERVLRQRQAKVLQGGHCAGGARGLDIGRVLVHSAAGADGAGHCQKVVA